MIIELQVVNCENKLYLKEIKWKKEWKINFMAIK